jgi:GAF domain-containing protein
VTPPDRAAAAPTTDVSVAPVLTAALRAAASGSRLEATLHDIVRAAVRHVDAEYGAMGVLSADGRRLDRFVIVGMGPDDRERIGQLPAGHGILGLLVDEPNTLRLDDLGEHPESIGFPPGHPAMHSFLGVPIRVGDSLFGNLYLTEKVTGGPFTPADAEVAQALAAVAGMAIENARLAERAETRRRWGQAATEMATALLSGADPDQVLRAVSTQVSALCNADMAGVLAPSVDDDATMTIVAAVGQSAGDVEGVRFPTTAGS